MPTEQQIHNAELISEAMHLQSMAEKAQAAAKAINAFLHEPHKEFLEPMEALAISKAQQILSRLDSRLMYDTMTKKI